MAQHHVLDEILALHFRADFDNIISITFPPDCVPARLDPVCHRSWALLLNPKWVAAAWLPHVTFLRGSSLPEFLFPFPSTSGSVLPFSTSGDLIHAAFFVSVPSRGTPFIPAARLDSDLPLSQASDAFLGGQPFFLAIAAPEPASCPQDTPPFSPCELL